MRVDQFDFDLPEERIALRPVRPRDAARMLVVRPQAREGEVLQDRSFRELSECLAPGDVLVVNDTRVIAAELRGQRRRGENAVSVQANLVHRLDDNTWEALARPGKRLTAGDRVHFAGDGEASVADDLVATVAAKGDGGLVTLSFDLSGHVLDEAVAKIGHMPLPPYIAGKRAEDEQDRADYQTVYAREEGAVAAPTAGLHFTDRTFEALKARGIGVETVTLHVGPGTFLPVKAEDTDDHTMHAEWGQLSSDVAERLNAVREAGGRIVAVGTTSLRLLESAVDENGRIGQFADETSIFITPGSPIRAADALITNFHLPRSTLFMLVCAFSGVDTMKRAYAHAIETGYRFYSYGDASLLFREVAA